MPRTKRAAENRIQVWHLDDSRCALAARIHVDHFGHEQQIDMDRLEQRSVFDWSARIRREVFVGPELQWIDEDTRDDAIRLLARLLREVAVASVQIAHCRNEGHALAALTPF